TSQSAACARRSTTRCRSRACRRWSTSCATSLPAAAEAARDRARRYGNTEQHQDASRRGHGPSMSDELLKLRNEIDRIDEEILARLAERARCAQRVGEIKRGVMYYRPEREAQVLR